MLAQKMGLRYERLLFFAGPLSLLCLLVLFVAVATESQGNLPQGRCYEQAAAAIEADYAKLDGAWGDQISRIVTREGKSGDYEMRVHFAWIDRILTQNRRCFRAGQESGYRPVCRPVHSRRSISKVGGQDLV